MREDGRKFVRLEDGHPVLQSFLQLKGMFFLIENGLYLLVTFIDNLIINKIFYFLLFLQFLYRRKLAKREITDKKSLNDNKYFFFE